MPAKSIRIEGQVQGVCFRAETKAKANELALTGWVMNRTDGSVDIHAEGPLEKLNQLEAWCHRGPPAAIVERVIVVEVPEEHAASFDIR